MLRVSAAALRMKPLRRLSPDYGHAYGGAMNAQRIVLTFFVTKATG
jgi:hypothetical protein